MSAVVSKVRASVQDARFRREHNRFSTLAYLVLTRGGKDDWLRFDLNVRIVRMCAQIVLFAVMLVVREALGRKILRR